MKLRLSPGERAMTLRALAYLPPDVVREETRDRQIFMRSDAAEVEAAELYARMRRWERLAAAQAAAQADPASPDRASIPEVSATAPARGDRPQRKPMAKAATARKSAGRATASAAQKRRKA